MLWKGAPYFKRKTEDVLVVEKRTIKLEVEIHSVPKAHVTWLKDGAEIKKDDRIQFIDAKGCINFGFLNHYSFFYINIYIYIYMQSS